MDYQIFLIGVDGKMPKHTVVIGGTDRAKKQYPPREYKSMRSARRRVKQLEASRDTGIQSVWILKGDK